MNPSFCNRAVAIVSWIFLAIVLPATHADTLRLKDGTVVEGTILEEDNFQITMEIQFAEGTIQTRRTYKKSDVTGISRLTPEQRAERDMLEAQEKALKYQLNPQASYQLAYYDHVMKDVFGPFLATYPDAPKAEEVKILLEQWQAERDRVAGGNVKTDGQWLSASAATEKYQREQMSRSLQQARAQIAAGEFAGAMETCRSTLATARDPGAIAQANALFREARDKWIQRLTVRREWINQQIQATQKQIEHASQAGATAANRVTFRNTAEGKAVKTLGRDASSVMADTMDKQRKQAEEQLAALQEQLAIVEGEIDEVKTRSSSPSPEGSPELAQNTFTNQTPTHETPATPSREEPKRTLPKWFVPAAIAAGVAFVLWLVFGK